MTHEHAVNAGYVCIDGQWFAPNHPRARVARKLAVEVGRSGEAPKLECNPGNGTVGKVQVQRGVGRRFLVVVTAIRTRLLDEDNLCEKYHVDLCRYAGVLPGDGPGTTSIEVRQQKAEPGQGEFVRVEVYER